MLYYIGQFLTPGLWDNIPRDLFLMMSFQPDKYLT